MAKLPKLLDRKLYKTGQTRGADDDVIFQNRVLRNSTVLIPFSFWGDAHRPPSGEKSFENGFVALISPDEYFNGGDKALKENGLKVGTNALVFYETRRQWREHNPEKRGLKPASQRTAPLGGEFVARVASTTAAGDERINRGYTTTGAKGAGIRVYEYASSATIGSSRVQLEALFWLCVDSIDVAVSQGMSLEDASERKSESVHEATKLQLLDIKRLQAARILGPDGQSVCPLCLEEISAAGFFSRMEQAAGRAVHDLTVTELNLFHIKELRLGEFGHRPYNIGWGHHHCNVVVKDSGIDATLIWMEDVLSRNENSGYLLRAKSGKA